MEFGRRGHSVGGGWGDFGERKKRHKSGACNGIRGRGRVKGVGEMEGHSASRKRRNYSRGYFRDF